MKNENILWAILGWLVLLKLNRGASVGAYPILENQLPNPAVINGKYVPADKTIRQMYLRMKRGIPFEDSKVSSSRDIVPILRKAIGDKIEIQEVVVAIYLTRANKTIGYTIHNIGSIGASIVDVSNIAATAINAAASSVIVCHNHPSGTLKPSGADIEITRKLKAALSTFDIMLLDHIIVTKEGYFSFGDDGIL